MKLLLDENLPHALRRLLPEHDAYTVAYLGWAGLTNGALLARAASDGFDALLTQDSGMQYQQDVQRLPLSVVVLVARTNTIEDLEPLLPALRVVLASLAPCTLVRVG